MWASSYTKDNKSDIWITTYFESSLLHYFLSPLSLPASAFTLRLFAHLLSPHPPQLPAPHHHGTAANVAPVSTTTLLFVADMLAPVLPPPLHLHTLHSHRSTSTLTPHGTCLFAGGTVAKMTLRSAVVGFVCGDGNGGLADWESFF